MSTQTPCPRCDGCGQLANSDDREPWSVWLTLPLQSAVAVTMGLVKPEPCDECGGTGIATDQPAGQPCGCPVFTTHPTHRNPWCQCGHQYVAHASLGGTCTMIAPASPISDELVKAAAEHMHDVEQTYFGPSTYAPHIAQMLARAALEAAYPAIRQQVLDQVMARLIAEGGTERAKAIVREIGGAA